jgi:hypothetical protein
MNTITLKQFIEILGIKTKDEGMALWAKIANRDVYLDDVYVETSSFRGNGAIIAEVCGGDYMTYYCSNGTHAARERIDELFMEYNVSTKGT